MTVFDVAVVGGGLAGQIAALAFAKHGFETVLIAPDDGRTDQRTTALMDHSLGFLGSLGVWDSVKPEATALSTMQIVDATARLLRAPTVAFKASEIGLEAFGYNVPNAPLLKILGAEIAKLDNMTVMNTHVLRADLAGEHAGLHLADGATIDAALVIAADGRKSLIRDAAGIHVATQTYPQTAVVLNFAHERPHRNVSTEFHTKTGPFTQVPLPGGLRSSLVWVVEPQQAVEMLQLGKEVLNRRIETQMQSILGKVNVEANPQAWPLSAATAKRFGKGQVVLIGEAAHVFAPIGAQGLNLSLRDIEQAVALCVSARSAGKKPAVGDAYDSRRRADIWSRSTAIDLLNRSLLSGFLPVQMLRAAGLQMLSSLPPLRTLAMQEGVAPGRGFRSLPALLREQINRKRA